MTALYVDGDVGSDSNLGTSPGAGNAWLTVGKGTTTMAGSDTLNVKARAASAVYSVSTTLTPPAGTQAAPTVVRGYSISPGDGGRPTIKWTGGSSGFIFTHSNTHQILADVILDGNSVTATQCVHCSGASNVYTYINVDFLNGGAYGLGVATGLIRVAGGKARNCATAGYLLPNNHTLIGTLAELCGVGYSAGGRGLYFGAASRANTSHGWALTGAGSALMGPIGYGNGGDGINLGGGTSDYVVILNGVLVNNAGYEINSPTNVYTGPLAGLIDYNAFYVGTGTGARQNVPAGAHDVVLTGDPFTAAASNDFSVISTGAGAQLRAAGFPGATTWGSTGYRDIGPFQHADPSGTGGGQSRYRTGS